jgi:hypothetical protein
VDIEEQLKDALATAVKGGQTIYAVAKSAGLKPDLLYRFASGERDLRLKNAAKLASVLGLTLTPTDAEAGHAKSGPKNTAQRKQK